VLGAIGGISVNNAVELPALDGRLPLGLLAALGLLRLLGDLLGDPCRLSFTPTRGTAVLHSPLKTPGDIADLLATIVAATTGNAVVPGLDPRFPLPAGSGKDPTRPQRESYREFSAHVSRIDPLAARQWLPNLCTDLAVDPAGRADITPFASPRGKQNMRTFFSKSLDLVRDQPGYLGEALTGWRRVPGVTGEYLDHRVLNSPVDDPAGMEKAERGVPGATWLATMAIPMLRLSGDGRQRAATLWHHVGYRHVMIWPLWRHPLDESAVQALIEHPCLKPVSSAPSVSCTYWDSLGITGVYGAERQKLPDTDKFPGVLAPLRVAAVE
jgi:hypothetical protein